MGFPAYTPVRRKVLLTTGDTHNLDNGGGIVYLATDPDKEPGSPDSQWITFEWWNSEDYHETGKYKVYREDIRPDMLKELDWLKARVERVAAVDCPKWDADNRPTKRRGEWLWREWRGQLGAWRISNHLQSIAKTCGTTSWELARLAKSALLAERVLFVENVLCNYGPENLDSYPEEYTRRELRRRWGKHVAGSVIREKGKTHG